MLFLLLHVTASREKKREGDNLLLCHKSLSGLSSKWIRGRTDRRFYFLPFSSSFRALWPVAENQSQCSHWNWGSSQDRSRLSPWQFNILPLWYWSWLLKSLLHKTPHKYMVACLKGFRFGLQRCGNVRGPFPQGQIQLVASCRASADFTAM